MAQERSQSSGISDTVRTALISAAATIAVAVITGVFGLMMRNPTPENVVVAATETPTSLPISRESPTSTPTETALPSPTPSVTPTPQPPQGLLFSAQIAPDGRALDPGLTFAADVRDLYAVFQPGQTPPGMGMAIEDAVSDAHYAFLRPTNRSLQTFGWRWYKDGAIVNEYQADATGDTVWLQIFSQTGGPLADALAGPGRYRVVILLDGNPSLSAELVIGEEE